jgi:hypothetical protein
MNTKKLKSVAAFLLAVCIVICSAPVSADVGARVYIQGWDPRMPAKHLFVTPAGMLEGDRPVLSDPKAISNAVGAGWNAARATICDQIKATLRAANGGSKGISFTEINCEMSNDSALALFSTAPYNSRNFLLRFGVRGNYIDLHSTTPNIVDDKVEVWGGVGGVLGGAALGLPGVVVGGVVGFFAGLLGQEGLGDWADPEFKIYYDLTVDVAVDGRNILQTGLAMFSVGNIQVSNVQANPANASGSLIKAATDFAHAIFQTPAFNALVTKGIQDGISKKDAQGHDLKDNINIFIQQFNTPLMASINNAFNSAKIPQLNINLNPNNYVALPLWGKNNMINLVLALRQVPLPLTGIIEGKIRMMKTQWFSNNACPPAPGLVSDVAIGPAPILDVDPFVYGDPPMGTFLGTVQYTAPGQIGYARNPATGVQYPTSFDCPYRLFSIPGFVPSFIHYNNNGTGGLTGVSGPSHGAQGSGARTSTVFTIKPIGWDTHVVPNPRLTGKDWEASVGLSLTGSIANVQTTPYIDNGDPYNKFNPAEQKANPQILVNPGAVAPSAQKVTPGVTQTLNPQPLPPKVLQQQTAPQR